MEKIVDIIESCAHEKGLDILEVRNTVTLALLRSKKFTAISTNTVLKSILLQKV